MALRGRPFLPQLTYVRRGGHGGPAVQNFSYTPLVIKPAIGKSYQFVDRRIGKSSRPHFRDKRRIDSVVLHSYQLIDRHILKPEFFETVDELRAHAVILHSYKLFERRATIAARFDLLDEFAIHSVVNHSGYQIERLNVVTQRFDFTHIFQRDSVLSHADQLLSGGSLETLQVQLFDKRYTHVVHRQRQQLVVRGSSKAPLLKLSRKRRVGRQHETPRALSVLKPAFAVERSRVTNDLKSDRRAG